jgi:hypothetical protein
MRRQSVPKTASRPRFCSQDMGYTDFNLFPPSVNDMNSDSGHIPQSALDTQILTSFRLPLRFPLQTAPQATTLFRVGHVFPLHLLLLYIFWGFTSWETGKDKTSRIQGRLDHRAGLAFLPVGRSCISGRRRQDTWDGTHGWFPDGLYIQLLTGYGHGAIG